MDMDWKLIIAVYCSVPVGNGFLSGATSPRM